MFNKIKDLNVKDKVVFVRADMNISIKDGKIIDDTRIKDDNHVKKIGGIK